MKIKKYLWIIIAAVVLIAGGIVATVLIIKDKTKFKGVEFSAETEFLEYFGEKIYEDNLDENTDTDGDGLTDVVEVKEYRTNPFTNDTDADGLVDYDEVYIYLTDPTNEDTDNDKVNDGTEIWAGLNPLEKKTDGKTLDNKVRFEKNYTMSGLTLDISGKASVCNVNLSEFTYGGNNTSGLISPIYELHTEGKFDEAVITIQYDPNKISEESSPDNLSIYQYVDSGDWEKVKSEVDEENNTVSAELEHFSKYAVLDETKIGEEKDINIMFVMDDSGSMYPLDMCEGSTESDVDFKRLDFVNDLAKKFDDDVNLGLASFTADYMLQCDMGATDEEIYAATEAIKNNEERNFNGTHILKSLDAALDTEEFKSDAANYIILLTDGATTETGWDLVLAPYSKDSIKSEAKDKNVTIISIGLGSYVDVEFLTDFTNATNGLYAYANNADALDNVYDKIMDIVNEQYIDINEDGFSDEVFIADTGFDVMTEGLSFSNPIIHMDGETGGGVCAGIAILLELNHLGIVPTSMGNFDYTNYDSWAVRWMSKTFKMDGHENVVYEECPGYDVSLLEDLGFTITGDKAVLNNVYDNLCTETTKAHWELHSMAAEDRMEADGDELVYREDVLDKISDNEMLDTFSFEGSWELGGDEYDECEYLGYDLDAEYSDDEGEYDKTIQIFQLFTRMFYEQYDSDGYVAYTFDNDLDDIINQIRSGNAMYIFLNGNHAINAVSITRDFILPNVYYLYAYDNNSPGELQKYTIQYLYEGAVQITDEAGEIASMQLRDYRYIKNK